MHTKQPLQVRISSCSAGPAPAVHSLAALISAHSGPSADDISSFCHQAAMTVLTK